MKRLIILVLLVFGAADSYGDEETLFKNSGDFELNGFWGGPGVSVTSINGNAELLVGGRGGIIINNSFNVGGGGWGLVTEPKAPSKARSAYPGRDLKLDFDYGGFIFEYDFRPKQLTHCSVYSLIGSGNVSYCDKDDDSFKVSDSFFVFEPGIEGTVNVTKWFRLSAGASYRVIAGMDIIGLDASDIGGFSGKLTFRFGQFTGFERHMKTSE
ncbi:hypothetical protein LLG96_06335 [bacterium]|nr:hypothetical protein [bacterium]